MTRMQINGSETGVVRLFQLDLPPEAVERFTTQAGTGEYPLKYALGARQLRPAFVDVVAIRDLGDMSLSTYLAEAHQLRGAEFRQMKPRLDALKGYVLVLPSQAFDRASQELTVATPLRWIGTFDEEQARPRGPALRSASASRTLTGKPVSAGPINRRALILALVGLGVLVLLILASVLRVSG